MATVAQAKYERLGGWGQRTTESERLEKISHILLQDKIEERIKNAVPVDSYIASLLDRQRRTVGREFVWSVRTQLNEATGFAAEDEDLPNWGHPSGIQPTGKPKSLYMAMALTGESMVMAPRVTRATFARTLSEALKAFEDGWRLEKAFQIWSPVKSMLAKVKTAISSNTKEVELKDLYGITPDTGATQLTDEFYPLFRPGMRLYFSDGTTDANNIGVECRGMKVPDVLDASGESPTIKVDRNIDAMSINSEIYKWSGHAAIATETPKIDKDNGFSGILELFSSGATYFGINKADHPIWKPIVTQMSTANLTEDQLQRMWDRTQIYSHMNKPSILISNHQTCRVYQALMTGQRRFHNTMTLKGGYKVLDFNGMPWTRDKRCPSEHLFYLTPGDWQWLQSQEERWLNVNNPGNIFQWTGKNVWQAYRWYMGELVCMMPNNQYLLKGIDA